MSGPVDADKEQVGIYLTRKEACKPVPLAPLPLPQERRYLSTHHVAMSMPLTFLGFSRVTTLDFGGSTTSVSSIYISS